jgi:hypothetical protein
MQARSRAAATCAGAASAQVRDRVRKQQEAMFLGEGDAWRLTGKHSKPDRGAKPVRGEQSYE